jgi:hypothetical protein
MFAIAVVVPLMFSLNASKTEATTISTSTPIATTTLSTSSVITTATSNNNISEFLGHIRVFCFLLF